MTNLSSSSPTFSKRVFEALSSTRDSGRWEKLIGSLLRRLELDAAQRDDAEREYLKLADSIGAKLDIPRHDVEVYPQGSMRTQTTIRPRNPSKFDLDIVVELKGPKYENPDSEAMFQAFGDALTGNEDVTGTPEPRRRCWRLQYPNKPYYFDVTPAVSDISHRYGAALRVRDPETVWTPSNPEDFAAWFCERTDLRFHFQNTQEQLYVVEARKSVDPLPDEAVGIDDILRRTVQLMKLHRDNFYFYATPEQKEAMPISVIIVTLAANAFADIWQTRVRSFRSPIEVVLAVVEEMPRYIDRATGKYWVRNPELAIENFADRWNRDGEARAKQFRRWHAALEGDLEILLSAEYSSSAENSLRSVFGQAGVDAWRASIPHGAQGSPLLNSLVASSGTKISNPTSPTPIGRKTNTLA